MREASSEFDNNLGDSLTTLTITNSTGVSTATLKEKTKLLRNIQRLGVYGVSSSDIVEQQNIQLRYENFVLKEILSKIEERISKLEASRYEEKIIVLREISTEDATKEIKKLFASGKTMYYSDIAQELGLDLKMVVDICNRLQEQGEIAVDDGAH